MLFRFSGPVSFGFSSLECPSTLKSIDGTNDYPVTTNSPSGSFHSNSSLKNELQTTHVSKNFQHKPCTYKYNLIYYLNY